ncbi:adenylate cyclase type 2 [Trichonephila clavipes]|nr:adenylate cyclase type 2 [Trichonephila clavipes]
MPAMIRCLDHWATADPYVRLKRKVKRRTKKITTKFIPSSSLESMTLPIAVRAGVTITSLILYIISYQEKWFFSSHSRIILSCFLLILTVAAETTTSIQRLANGYPAGQRFSAYYLLICTIFLPFPKWYQVGLATTLATMVELVISGLSYRLEGTLNWNQMSSDVIFHVTVALMGLYIRFLMEFTNRKAFLDRRECFESKFHLQYEKDQEEGEPGVVRDLPPTSLLLRPTSREGFGSHMPLCLEDTIYLQTFMPSPELEPGSCDTTVSVANTILDGRRKVC